MAFTELTEDEIERFDLAYDRLKEIKEEKSLSEPFLSYFHKEAAFLVRMADLKKELHAGKYENASQEELEALNQELYGELLGKKYAMAILLMRRNSSEQIWADF